MTDDERPNIGITHAAHTLNTLRQQLDAQELRGHWETPHGDIELVVDQAGARMYHNGALIPLDLEKAAS